MWERVFDGSKLLCASEACCAANVVATWYFEAGGVGSPYCDDCKSEIEDFIPPTQEQIARARAWGEDV